MILNFPYHYGIAICLLLVLQKKVTFGISQDVESDKKHTVSSILEFIVLQYNRYVITEKELDELLESYDIEKKEKEFHRQLELKADEYRKLTKEAEKIIQEGKQGKLSKSQIQLRARQINEHKEKLTKNLRWLQENITTVEEVNKFHDQYNKISEDIKTFIEMTVTPLYNEQLHLFETLADVELNNYKNNTLSDEENNTFELFDIKVLEKLLKKYKKLDSLKSKFKLVFGNPKDALPVQKQIDALENEIIPQFIDENREIIKLYTKSLNEILDRHGEKLVQLNELMTNLTELLEKTTTELKNTIAEFARYNDILEEVADVWSKSKEFQAESLALEQKIEL